VTLENELISWLQKNLPPSPRLLVGLGDDAAVLSGFDQSQLVVTTDLLTDQVDFVLDDVDPRQVGHKALAVNLSDLAAMAARPVAAFVSLVLPRSGCANRSAGELAVELYRGMLPLAERHGVTIAGGDTNSWNAPLAISITAIGETTPHGPLTRAGAQVGDQLLVTGKLGGSILGRHLEVEPRVDEALLLHERYELHAGIDISDGLALDTSRLAEASHVGTLLDLSAIPIAGAARELSKRDSTSALKHALTDGEDFELVLALPPNEATRLVRDQPLSIPLTIIGQIIAEPGLWQLNADGERAPLAATGYQHRGNE